MATRLLPLVLVLVSGLGLAGCGGSSSPSGPSNPGATGGGAVADYAGSYVGTEYAPPTDASRAAAATGSLALTVGADGAVAATRHDAATNADQALAGTVTADGTLSLSGADQIFFRGSLVKRPSGAVAALAELNTNSPDIDVAEGARYVVLAGGSAAAGAEPLTVAKPDVGVRSLADTRRGAWSRPDAGLAGALRLTYAASGRAGGAWTEADGTVRASPAS